MPLSEYEQRVLDELERDLGTDPKLKNAMARAPRASGRLATTVFGVILGLGIVVAGVMAQIPLLGVAGFALMIIVSLWSLLGPSGRAQKTAKGGKADTKGGAAKGSKKGRQGFMSRLEERFERRREQGDL